SGAAASASSSSKPSGSRWRAAFSTRPPKGGITRWAASDASSRSKAGLDNPGAKAVRQSQVMPPPSVWTPILDGSEAGRAGAAVGAIAEALRTLPAASLRRSAHELALFEAYLVRANHDARDDAAPMRWLDVAADVVAEQAMSPGLWGGFLGIAWVVEHV